MEQNVTIEEVRETINCLKPECPEELTLGPTPECQHCEHEEYCAHLEKLSRAFRRPYFFCYCGQKEVAERGHDDKCRLAQLQKDRRRLEDRLRKDESLCAQFCRLVDIGAH